MSLNGKLILAIEAAIDGGSIAIFDQSSGNEIAHWTGESKISKSEDLLKGFSVLLRNYRINKNSFGLVVSATEAGSLTGVKIGAATAQGLAKSFDCQYKEISLWNVLVKITAEESATTKIFYLPAGRAGVMRRVWEANNFKTGTEIISVEQFLLHTDFEDFRDARFYVHESLSDIKPNPASYQNLGHNLAGYIAKVASDNELGLASYSL